MHNYTFATIYVLNARFEENLENILKKEENRSSLVNDFLDTENLELTVLASLGIVLKVSTLEEVKEMLKEDRLASNSLFLAPCTDQIAYTVLYRIGITLVTSTTNCSTFELRLVDRSLFLFNRSTTTTSIRTSGDTTITMTTLWICRNQQSPLQPSLSHRNLRLLLSPLSIPTTFIPILNLVQIGVPYHLELLYRTLSCFTPSSDLSRQKEARVFIRHLLKLRNSLLTSRASTSSDPSPQHLLKSKVSFRNRFLYHLESRKTSRGGTAS